MRFLVAMLLLAVATPSWSGWTLMHEDSEARIYADFDDVLERDLVKGVWLLWENNVPDDLNITSAMNYYLIDCSDNRLTPIFTSIHPERITAGASLGHSADFDENPSDKKWRPTASGSVAEAVVRVVCRSLDT